MIDVSAQKFVSTINWFIGLFPSNGFKPAFFTPPPPEPQMTVIILKNAAWCFSGEADDLLIQHIISMSINEICGIIHCGE